MTTSRAKGAKEEQCWRGAGGKRGIEDAAAEAATKAQREKANEEGQTGKKRQRDGAPKIDGANGTRKEPTKLGALK